MCHAHRPPLAQYISIREYIIHSEYAMFLIPSLRGLAGSAKIV
jgi:hypothetical protein